MLAGITTQLVCVKVLFGAGPRARSIGEGQHIFFFASTGVKGESAGAKGQGQERTAMA